MDRESFRDELGQLAARLGFAGLGIVAAREFAELGEVLRRRQAGRTYPLFCERAVARRTRPDEWLRGCRSLWVAALPYAAPGVMRREKAPSGSRPLGRIAAYALPEDYHAQVRRRLKVLARWAARRAGCSWRRHFRVLVDTGPPVERYLWERSRAGWIGKNTCAYAPGAGSWVVLGVIASTLPVPEGPALVWTNRSGPPAGISEGGSEAPPPPQIPVAPCAGCARCIEACPTGALEPYRMDPNRCIAQFSQRRGRLAPFERENLHRWLFGCDICQIVCPYNAPGTAPLAFSADAAMQPVPGAADRISLEDVLSMSEQAFETTLGRGAVSWRGLSHLKKNAAYALGTRARRGLQETGIEHARSLRDLAALHPSPAVREACAWALAPLTPAAQADHPSPLQPPSRTRPSGEPSPPESARPGR